MNIAETANDIQVQLQIWANLYQGIVQVAANTHQMWKQCYSTTQVPRLIIAWAGDTIRGDFSVAAAMGRIDRLWHVAIIRGRSMDSQRNALSTPIQNAVSFYQLVEESRDVVRTLAGVSVEPPVDFRNITQMEGQEGLIDGYLIEFSTVADLPRPIRDSNNQTSYVAG